jgi:hypothetical protein
MTPLPLNVRRDGLVFAHVHAGHGQFISTTILLAPGEVFWNGDAISAEGTHKGTLIGFVRETAVNPVDFVFITDERQLLET